MIVIIQKAAMPPLIASLAHPVIALQSRNLCPQVMRQSLKKQLPRPASIFFSVGGAVMEN
ncbi:hypothetical protein OUZ56_005748 [Daphnia magna]|uniref:Uncharacterized protein n=1 Tax=Daphnia magna TaxID=35525 RepID=A0ABQ9YTN3_9CRUS|nr:hypothetical protein OUZ56_005748 [Daphnia magna]